MNFSLGIDLKMFPRYRRPSHHHCPQPLRRFQGALRNTGGCLRECKFFGGNGAFVGVPSCMIAFPDIDGRFSLEMRDFLSTFRFVASDNLLERSESFFSSLWKAAGLLFSWPSPLSNLFVICSELLAMPFNFLCIFPLTNSSGDDARTSLRRESKATYSVVSI